MFRLYTYNTIAEKRDLIQNVNTTIIDMSCTFVKARISAIFSIFFRNYTKNVNNSILKKKKVIPQLK